jgi:DNA-binding MarR family transcriptional regulator
MLPRRLRRLITLYQTMLATELPGFASAHYAEIILTLGDHELPINNKILSAHLQVNKSRVTVLINYLAQHQYIITYNNPNNKREQLVALTEKGKQLVPVVKKAVQKVNSVLHQQLEQHNLISFYMTLNQMERNMSNQAKQ